MPSQNRLQHWFWLIFVLALAWLLGPYWADSQVPAFRDGYHFYYPQAVWLDGCYARGEIFPKWNPNEGLGSSVEGQPTWQLYYPLRTVWLIPYLSVAQRYALFCAIHLALAAGGVLRAGRLLGFQPASNWLAAVAYSLSCPVLFQMNNLIYLCSAAWLAWGLVPILQLVLSSDLAVGKGRRYFYAGVLCETVAVGSLMTLGGDPHGAVNFGLVWLAAFALHGCRWIYKKYGANPIHLEVAEFNITAGRAGLNASFNWPWMTGLLLAVTLSSLAVVQVRATVRWYRLSSRANVNLNQVNSNDPVVANILKDNSLVQPQRIFDFSLSPWTLPTLLWPTWAGHFQPVHSRWVQAIPSEGRMWIPSIYLGIIPVLLALKFFIRGYPHSATNRFLIGLCLVTLLASMGNYSLVWLLRNMLDALGSTGLSDRLPTDAQGSFYGLLIQLIPGYDGFRYPAKWSPWVVICISLMAASALNQLIERKHMAPGFHRWIVGFVLVCGILCAGLLACWQIDPIVNQFKNWIIQSPDTMLGLPDPQASLNSVLRALIQPAVISIFFLALLRGPTRMLKLGTAGSGWLITVLTLADLTCVGSNWIVSTPSVDLPRAEQPIHSGNLRWANTSRAEVGFISSSNSASLQQTLKLQEIFLQGKLNHLQGLATLHASGAIEPQSVVVLKRWLQRHDNLATEQPQLDEVLQALGVGERLSLKRDGQLQWQTIPAAKPLCEVLSLTGLPDKIDPTTIQNTCTWQWIRSDQLQVKVESSLGGILYVRQLNDGGWRAESESLPSMTIVPENLFITYQVTAGRHRVTFIRE